MLHKQEQKYIIRVLSGKFGKGKTTTNAIIALIEKDDTERYEKACERIKELAAKKNREFNLPTQKHVVYANFEIKDDDFKAYDFEPEKFMLPNNEGKNYDIFPPYSCFHIQEAQGEGFSAYDWGIFPRPALKAFARIRHPKFTFTFDVPSLENLNKNIRKYAFEYLTPLELKHEYDCLNRRISTTSHCAVFYDYNKALEYELTQDKALIKETRDYFFKGDIYECFDSNEDDDFYEVTIDKNFVYERVAS